MFYFVFDRQWLHIYFATVIPLNENAYRLFLVSVFQPQRYETCSMIVLFWF